MPKKILIVTECFYPEEFKINDVALVWKEKGYDVDILTLAPTFPLGKIYPGYSNKIFSKNKWNGINVYRVHATLGYKENRFKKILKYLNFMFLGSIVALFIGKKYDYVLGFNMSALTAMIPAILIRKLYKKPVTFWTLDIWPDGVYAYGFKKTKFLSNILDKFVRFMFHNIDNIALSSKGFEAKLKPYSNGNLNFNYLPQWTDDLNMKLKPVSLSNDNRVQFTFAGNVGRLQNLENIIRAFCLLSSDYQKNTQLNIIGDGTNLNNLKLLAKKNSNVVFHGKKPRSDMASYYKASNFLIISLVDKPMSSVTVPAKTQTYIKAKKPILAIIKGDTARIVQENNLGLCAHPSKIDAIVTLFTKCIEMDQAEIQKFTKRNDYLSATIFNKEKIIDSLLKLVTSERIN